MWLCEKWERILQLYLDSLLGYGMVWIPMRPACWIPITSRYLKFCGNSLFPPTFLQCFSCYCYVATDKSFVIQDVVCFTIISVDCFFSFLDWNLASSSCLFFLWCSLFECILVCLFVCWLIESLEHHGESSVNRQYLFSLKLAQALSILIPFAALVSHLLLNWIIKYFINPSLIYLPIQILMFCYECVGRKDDNRGLRLVVVYRMTMVDGRW